MNALTTDDIKKLVQQFYARLVHEHQPIEAVHPDDLDALFYSQKGIVEDVIIGLRGQITCKNYEDSVHTDAKRALETASLSREDLSSSHYQQLLEGVCRARIEYAKYGLSYMNSALDAYTPEDPVFRTVQLSAAKNPVKSTPVFDNSPKPGHSIADLVAKYIQISSETGTSSNGPWKPKTTQDISKSLNWFVQLVGADTDAKAITTEHVRTFRDRMLALKRGVGANTNLDQAITSNPQDRVGAKTAKKHFMFLRAFLNWLVAEAYIDSAPGTKVGVPVPKKAKSEQRRSFTKDELNQFFASPLFMGCQSAKRLYKPGHVLVRNDDFWVPLLLFYTGMRLAEALQLRVSDVYTDGSTPHICLSASHMQLKTHSSERLIPIHPDLVNYGFLDFVAKRQAKTKPLFSGIQSAGDISNYYSKKLGRYLRKIGILDPNVTTHSFRHTFKDTLRNAKIPEEERNQIMGHSNGTVSEQYGVGANIETLAEYMEKVEFGLSDALKTKLAEK